MAARAGVDGFISFASSSSGGTAGTTEKPTYIDSWNFNVDVAMADITNYASNGYKEFSPMVRGWTGSAGGTLDKASTEQQNLIFISHLDTTAANLPVFVRFYESTAYWLSKANLTGISINSAITDKVKVTYNFQGTTALSYVTT